MAAGENKVPSRARCARNGFQKQQQLRTVGLFVLTKAALETSGHSKTFRDTAGRPGVSPKYRLLDEVA